MSKFFSRSSGIKVIIKSINNCTNLVVVKKLKIKTVVANVKHLFKNLIYFTFVILLLSNCVPNKKIVYLQHGQELKTKHTTDSVLRSYQLKKEPYKLKSEDIISLRVASVTEEEYNFIRQYEMQLGQIRKLNQYSQGASGNQGQGSFRGMNYNQMNNMQGGASSLFLSNLNSGFKIDSRGQLDLPQIGKIDLGGLTITEAEEKIQKALQGYYETPMVRIELLSFHFTILGEVENEGRYTSFDPEMNIFDAFLLSGNLTEFADRSNIKIVRNDGDEAEIIYLNTLDEDLLLAKNYFLKPNDLIIVPPLKARTSQRYTIPRTNTIIGIVSSSLSLIALIITLNR